MDFNKRVQEVIPVDKPHISNSALSDVKKIILGQPLFHGGEQYLKVGSEIHRQVLEPHLEPECEFGQQDQEVITGSVAALMAGDVLPKDFHNMEKEEVLFDDLFGVRMKVILDILDRPTRFGADLKTTSCLTEASFLKSMYRYDYFRQAWIYMQVAKLERFQFIAVSKKNFKTFIVDMADYPEEMENAARETEMLVDVIKTVNKWHKN